MSSSTARGRGGKFSKPKRGGGKHFSRDLQPVNADGEVISMWAEKEQVEENLDESEESSEEESDDDGKPEQETQTREQRKALAKARKEAAIARQKAAATAAAPGDLPPSESDEDSGDDMPANPNHTPKAREQLSGAGDADSNSKKPVAELSRREREALQAQQARERYQKLHAEGKTEEARADLERLRIVREQREAAAARKKAEMEEKAEAEKEKQAQLEKEREQREAAMGPGASKRGGRGGKRK